MAVRDAAFGYGHQHCSLVAARCGGCSLSARVLVAGLLAVIALIAVPPRAGAERYTRTFNWSGQTWKVRVAQRENPGRNTWGDSPLNVRVRGDGKLRLGITSGRVWKSVEIAGVRSLGYGRYRWVIDTDLSNPSQVFAVFVRDMAVSAASNGEQDVEFSRWNDPLSAPGWFVSWSKTGKLYSQFPVTNRPPYVIEIVWGRRSVIFYMRDSRRHVLLDRQVPAKSTGRLLYPRMSYWLLPDSARTAAPPPLLVRSFSFTKTLRHS